MSDFYKFQMLLTGHTKILVTFCQLTFAMEFVYATDWPPEFRELLRLMGSARPLSAHAKPAAPRLRFARPHPHPPTSSCAQMMACVRTQYECAHPWHGVFCFSE